MLTYIANKQRLLKKIKKHKPKQFRFLTNNFKTLAVKQCDIGALQRDEFTKQTEVCNLERTEKPRKSMLNLN